MRRPVNWNAVCDRLIYPHDPPNRGKWKITPLGRELIDIHEQEGVCETLRDETQDQRSTSASILYGNSPLA